MWWREILAFEDQLEADLAGLRSQVSFSANIAVEAILDDSQGPIIVGANTTICAGAVIRGPVVIGDGCLIGNYAMVRGPARIGNQCRIGFSTELKHCILGDRISIGPQCFVADTRIDDDAYLGAMVRTSNHRLDHHTVTVIESGGIVDTGSEKLGCWIGAGAALGIQVIVLPGRIVAPNSLYEPRITVTRNLPSGHYRAVQNLEAV